MPLFSLALYGIFRKKNRDMGKIFSFVPQKFIRLQLTTEFAAACKESLTAARKDYKISKRKERL